MARKKGGAFVPEGNENIKPRGNETPKKPMPPQYQQGQVVDVDDLPKVPNIDTGGQVFT